MFGMLLFQQLLGMGGGPTAAPVVRFTTVTVPGRSLTVVFPGRTNTIQVRGK